MPVPIARSDTTIDEALLEFLTEQRKRLSTRTYRRYEEVVELLRDCLDGYAYQSLDEEEHQRWQGEFETNEDGAFCRVFGPEKIVDNLGEFLGYFMVRKVIAGQELLKASGTVTGKLVRWLGERGYIDEASADQAGDTLGGSCDLPMAWAWPAARHHRSSACHRSRRHRRRRLGRGLPPDRRCRARQHLVRKRCRADRRAAKGKRSRPPRLVGVRDRCKDRQALALDRGRRRLPLTFPVKGFERAISGA